METNYKFELKEPQLDGLTSIRFKFHKSGKRFVYGTGKKIYPSLWDFDSQRPTKDSRKIKKYEKENPHIRTEVKNISNRCENIITETIKYFALKEEQKEKASFDDLRSFLKNSFDIDQKKRPRKQTPDEIYIDRVLMDFIRAIGKGEKTTKSGGRYAYSTIKTIKNLHTLFSDFQDHIKRRIEITEISKELYEQFQKYMNDEQYSINTTGKHFSNLKSIIRDRLDDIVDINYKREKENKAPVLSEKYIQRINRGLTYFTVKEVVTTEIALTELDLAKLYDVDLSKHPHWEKARDVFLCGCYTATRFSDFSRFGKEHFKKKFDGNYIEINTLKTGVKVSIPVRPELEAILKKHKFKMPVISEQKINKYIKKVGELAKIDELIEVVRSKGAMNEITTVPKYKLIKTHTARRTGATLMYQSGEFTHKDIMKITGHKKIDSFEKYLRIDDSETARKMSTGKFFRGRKLKKA